jgi:hypothetical protein
VVRVLSELLKKHNPVVQLISRQAVQEAEDSPEQCTKLSLAELF